jgi:hypothetical protein
VCTACGVSPPPFPHGRAYILYSIFYEIRPAFPPFPPLAVKRCAREPGTPAAQTSPHGVRTDAHPQARRREVVGSRVDSRHWPSGELAILLGWIGCEPVTTRTQPRTVGRRWSIRGARGVEVHMYTAPHRPLSSLRQVRTAVPAAHHQSVMGCWPPSRPQAALRPPSRHQPATPTGRRAGHAWLLL